MKKGRIISIIALLIAFAIFGIVMNNVSKFNNKLDKLDMEYFELEKRSKETVDNFKKAKNNNSKKKNEIEYKIKDNIELDKVNIIVHDIIQNYSSDFMKKVYKSENGLALDVSIENKSSENIIFNPIDFSIIDKNSREFIFYDISIGGKQPELGYMEMLSGEKRRGYITFVRNDNQEKVSAIYFKPSYTENIKINCADSSL